MQLDYRSPLLADIVFLPKIPKRKGEPLVGTGASPIDDGFPATASDDKGCEEPGDGTLFLVSTLGH